MPRIVRDTIGTLATWDGPSETASYAGLATLQTDTYIPPCGGGEGIALKVQVSSTCDVKLYEFDSKGAGKLVYTETGVTSAMGRKVIAYTPPFAGGYAEVVNTDNVAGTALVDVQEID